MKRIMKQLGFSTLGFAAILLTGCVNAPMKDLERQLSLAEVQNQDLEKRIRELEDDLEAERSKPIPRNAADIEKLNACKDKNNLLLATIADLEAKYRAIADDVPMDVTIQLPAEIDEALSRLAAANPNLMTYDPKLGMIKLANDVTFAPGSAEVKSAAAGAVKQLAGILNRSDVSVYDVVVVGHTDNVPIAKPSTKKKHPTNWHLSVHRAIGVLQVLTSAGVSNKRVAAKGYGQYAPVAENGPKGSEANRRVEIFLVKSSGGRGVAAAPSPKLSAGKSKSKSQDLDAQYK